MSDYSPGFFVNFNVFNNFFVIPTFFVLSEPSVGIKTVFLELNESN